MSCSRLMSEAELKKEQELESLTFQTPDFQTLDEYLARGAKNARDRARYAQNPAKKIASTQAYKAANRDRTTALSRAHVERTRERRRQQGLDRYRRIMIMIEGLKDVPCKDCGGRFPPECMDFDHVSGEKAGDIAKIMFRRKEALLEELAKTEVVCACCHRIRTRARKSSKGRPRKEASNVVQ